MTDIELKEYTKKRDEYLEREKEKVDKFDWLMMKYGSWIRVGCNRSYFKEIDYGLQFMGLQINNDDENIFNDFGFSYFNVLSELPDLSISYPTIEIGNCKTETVNLKTGINNNSCEEEFIGEDIFLEIFDASSNLIHTINKNYVGGISPGELIDINIELEASMFSQNGDVYFVISSSKDSYEDNNSANQLYNRAKVNHNVFYDFENGGFEDFVLNGYYSSGYFYENESYFIAENYFNESPCKNITDQSIPLKIETCLDVSNFAAPQLEFDLIQFQNDIETDPLRLKNSNTIEIKFIEDNKVVQSEIYNEFIEGTQSRKTIEIPAGFNGKMEMNFYLAYSKDFSGDIDEADIALLDNFSIHDIVATENLTKENSYILFPNPSNANLQISGKSNFEYEIFDNNGRNILQGNSLDNKKNIDISSLQNGSYIVKINDAQNVTNMKFIKL